MIRHVGEGQPVGQARAHMRQVGLLGGAVDDEVKRTARLGDHQVVEDSPIIGQEQRIAHGMGFEAQKIARAKGFEPGGRALPFQQKLSHVRNIEKAGVSAGPQMLRHHPFGILNRHGIAREGDHAPAQPLVKAGKGQGFQLRFVHRPPRS